MPFIFFGQHLPPIPRNLIVPICTLDKRVFSDFQTVIFMPAFNAAGTPRADSESRRNSFFGMLQRGLANSCRCSNAPAQFSIAACCRELITKFLFTFDTDSTAPASRSMQGGVRVAHLPKPDRFVRAALAALALPKLSRELARSKMSV
jgi:hypothetical protein